METLTECKVCGSISLAPFLVCTDYLVSYTSFTIEQCNACGFRFTNPRPSEIKIGTYYRSEQYISHNDNSGGIIGMAYRFVRKYTLRSKLKLINELNNGSGRILDVGCGTGAFLDTCKAGGWDIVGVEPDFDARAVSTTKLQIEVKPSLNALAKAKPFDMITLWHVLEHIHDLDQTIKQLCDLLEVKGTLLIAVPNSNSYDAVFYKEYWAAYDMPRHLYHFTPVTIESLFKKHGFRLVKKQPMFFDAFYITLLSSRYQTGRTEYVKSVWTALLSNFKARQTNNTSSITYLFQRVS